MLYQHEIGTCFADSIGPTGLDRAQFEATLAETHVPLDRLRAGYADGSIPLLRLPEATADLAGIEEVAARYVQSFEEVVVLGIGGSSLGGKALAALQKPPSLGLASNQPRVHFLDNIDPQGFSDRLRALNPARLGFIAISKSGRTAETLSQFMHCVGFIREVAPPRERFALITDPTDNPLRSLGDQLGIPIFEHPPEIGGRYSVLSNVGLLPALIAGIDVAAVRDGAHEVLKSILSAASPGECQPAVGAALNIALARHRAVTMTVLMPYMDQLAEFSSWYCQLWAESLGKNGMGTTPIRAMGAVDQHSQLQLYLDGPRDKLFTLIFNCVAGTGGEVPDDLAGDDELSYLGGKRIGDLMDAEQRATAETLARKGCPTRIIRIDLLNERTMGALMMHFMLETIIAANLMGVDPFDQPAVDDGKALARAYLATEKSSRV